ncbi:MAG: DUF3726 domain-containing protein [Pseudomonadota bacterium]
MIPSGGEIEALCRKAARGAGMTWGLAEEAGRAVRWLEGWGLAGADALAEVLAAPDFGAPRRDGRVWSGTCPIYMGAALTDRAVEIARTGVEVREVRAPLLLLPAFAFIAARRSMMLAWPGGSGFLGPGELWLDGEVPGGTVRARPGDVRSGVRLAAVPPRPIPEGVLAALTAAAERTYAPAHIGQEDGAGAGRTDND